jgi:hypothetical protein
VDVENLVVYLFICVLPPPLVFLLVCFSSSYFSPSLETRRESGLAMGGRREKARRRMEKE